MVEFYLSKKSNSHYLSKIKNEWQKFINGKSIDDNIVEKSVYESWSRSMDMNISPYEITSSWVLSEYDQQSQMLSYEGLINSFGNVIELIMSIVRKNNLCLQIFDAQGKSIKHFQTSNRLDRSNKGKRFIIKSACENTIGTNAASLCLKKNQPVQVVGPEHFNHNFHDIICSCAPIHDNMGNVAGAMNISSRINDNLVDTLPITICLASIFDSREMINDSLEKLNINDFALRYFIDSYPKGVAYLMEGETSPVFNTALEKLLAIKGPDEAGRHINQFTQTLSGQGKDLQDEQIIHNIGGETKKLTVSTKRIYNKNQDLKGRVVIVEETNNMPPQRLKGNKTDYSFDTIIGSHPKFIEAKNTAKQVAASHVPVLIRGESGTGKEVFAQSIHEASDRNKGPFVAINCGAIPTELIESELFGYAPGAFTGAIKGGKVGKLEQANGGTFFFDEVESMPLNVQIKLLRALSTKRIVRVGELKERPIDIRLISATKNDLLQEADNGRFREDLYYRICTITIALPSLKERRNDIPLLVEHFLETCCAEYNIPPLSAAEGFIDALSYYSWRGNIRELKNVTERAVALRGECSVLTTDLLPEKILKAYKYKLTKSYIDEDIESNLKENCSSQILKITEAITIERILLQQQGNISKTAKILGITKPTLYAKIKQNQKLLDLKTRLEQEEID